jgi:nitrite reductase (NO-forming)
VTLRRTWNTSISAAALTLALTACSHRAQPPLFMKNMPAIAGQRATCGAQREKAFDIDVIETTVDLGMGTRFAAWTYGGHVPGPTIEACEGDTITIRVHNKGTTSHGLDSHGLMIDARAYGPVPPGKTLTITKIVETPGVYMYHCSAGPVTDIHIKSGLHGAMIVYPRRPALPPARELVVVEDAVFGARDASGLIPGTDPARTARNDELFSMFNGRLDNEAVAVAAGDLVRVYFVNVGPSTAAVHVVGSLFERVSDGGTEWEHNVQTHGVPAGAGATLEFRIPEPGVFPLVDHDKLAFLPYGLSIAFTANGAAGSPR